LKVALPDVLFMIQLDRRFWKLTCYATHGIEIKPRKKSMELAGVL
jgi:hypothetical protein